MGTWYVHLYYEHGQSLLRSNGLNVGISPESLFISLRAIDQSIRPYSAPLRYNSAPLQLHYMSFTTINYPNTPDARRTADWLLAQHARRGYTLPSSYSFQFVESDDPSRNIERLNALALDAMLDESNPTFLDAQCFSGKFQPGIAEAQCTAMPSAQPSTMPSAPHKPHLNPNLFPTHDNTCSSSMLCYRPTRTIYLPTPTTKAVLPDSQIISAHSREFLRNQWYAFSRGLHKIDVGNRLDILPPARTTDLSNLTPSKPNLYNIPISQSIFAEPSSFENREFQLCSAISAVQASLSTESAQGIPCRSFIFMPGNENQFACLKSDHAPQSLFNIRCDYVSKIEPEPPPRFTFKYPLLFSVFQMSFRLLYAYGGSNSMGQYQFLDMYRVTSSS